MHISGKQTRRFATAFSCAARRSYHNGAGVLGGQQLYRPDEDVEALLQHISGQFDCQLINSEAGLKSGCMKEC